MIEKIVTVSRRGAERVANGHPWIYRSDVEKEPADVASGDVVAIVDGRRRFLAKAFWSSRSKITLRLLTRDEVPIDEAFFAARIAAAIGLRERAFPEEPCVRLVHGEADLLPGLVVDRYGDVAVMQTLVPATDRLKPALADMLWNAFRLRCVIERNDVRVRELEGLPLVKGLIRGVEPGILEYREGAVRMKLDPLGGQKTGAFLDQRENHLRAGEYAAGRCLDCFTYSGGFALQLARRAEQVTAVEMQPLAANLARENAQLNGAENMDVVEANAFDFLRDESEKEPAYDMVVLDPPAFAKNKDSIPAARRGYKEINLRAMRMIPEGGFLITCSCSYHMKSELFKAVVADAALDAHRRLRLVEERAQGVDHPIVVGYDESHYLKCLIYEVL